jgi:hypothetical protein
LTNQPAKTCIAGSWYAAEPISAALSVLDLNSWWRDSGLKPSYQIVGRILEVQLNGGNVCDNYVEVIAELTDAGGIGVMQEDGIFGGGKYGDVVIELLIGGAL